MLRTVAEMVVGVDSIDLETCQNRGVRVGHTPAVLAETTVDTAWCLLAVVLRRLPKGEQVIETTGGVLGSLTAAGDDLWGARMGIVGLGLLEAAFVRRGRFGLKILYSGPHRKLEAE